MLCLLSVFILVIATSADWVNETRQLYSAQFPPGKICFFPGVAATEADLRIECIVMSAEIYRYGYQNFKSTCAFIMHEAIAIFQDTSPYFAKLRTCEQYCLFMSMSACKRKICQEDKNRIWNRILNKFGMSVDCPKGVDVPGRMQECQYSNMRDKCGPRCQQATKLCKTAPVAHANTDPSQRDDVKS